MRRSVHTRENHPNESSSRENSPLRTGRYRRGGINHQTGTSTGNLALSGHTTTAKGYIIVPPTKAKIIAFEFEEAPSDHNSKTRDDENTRLQGNGEASETHDSTAGEATIEVSGDVSLDTRVHARLASAFRKSGADNPAAENLNARDSFNSTDAANADVMGAVEKDPKLNVSSNGKRNQNGVRNFDSNRSSRLSPLQNSKIVRHGRSISPTSITGNVTGTKSEVSSKITTLREEYAERKRGSLDPTSVNPVATDTRGRLNERADKTSSHSKLVRRRRDRTIPAQVPSDIRSKESASGSPGSSLDVVGDSNTDSRRRKYSPYLPTYIQPFVEERPPYRAQHSAMLYQSSIASQRNRKISTDMNRYDSSTSSARSSGSASENESPTRQPPSAAVEENLSRQSTRKVRTFDTSDTEKRHPDGRRRRLRRTRQQNKDGVAPHDVGPTLTGSVVQGEEILTQRGQNRVPAALLEDKYVTLPDNYKLSERQLPPHNFTNNAQAQSRVTKVKQSERGAPLPEAGERVGMFRSGSDELIIGSGQADGNNYKDRNETVGVEPTPHAGVPRIGHHLNSAVAASDNVMIHGPSVVKDSSTASSPKASDRELKVQGNSSPGCETKGLGNIRSIFEHKQAPKGEFGQTFLKKVQVSQGNNVHRLTRANTHDCIDNGVVQSQPKIKARKVSEDFWPRDEATQLLLSRKGLCVPTSPDNDDDYEISLTMQETIDQLHKFADDRTPISRTKARSNSHDGPGDSPQATDRSRSHSVDANARMGSGRLRNQHVCLHGRSGPATKVRLKLSPLDVSPCMSSTETLKECSSGECQGRNSRSHSIDSTTSNSEVGVQMSNPSSLKNRNAPISVESHGKPQPYPYQQNGSELFNTEMHKSLADCDEHSSHARANVEFPNMNLQFNSVSDSSTTNKLSTQKSMLLQMQELTASLRKFKLAGPAQHFSGSSADWQKATARTDPILSVLKGNVTSVVPNLETLSEHPELTSTSMKMKPRINSNNPKVTDVGIDHKVSPALETNKGSQSELNEETVSEEKTVDESRSFMLKERLCDLKKERELESQTSMMGDSEASSGTESVRSLSDPLPYQKTLSPEATSIDSNLVGPLNSKLSASHGIINTSESGDTDDLINESQSLDEECNSQQKPNKKKSFSDPNPEGVITHGFDASDLVIQEGDFQTVHNALSEPNVTEQTDKLGDLDRFKKYHSSKVMSETGVIRLDKNTNEQSAFDSVVDHVVPQRTNRKNMSMKARLRAGNDAMRGGTTMIDQLLASDAFSREGSNQHHMHREHSDAPSDPVLEVSAKTNPTRKPGAAETLLESEKQFLQMYDSMTCKEANDSLQSKEDRNGHLHLRSNSEPVDMRTGAIDDMDNFEQLPNSANRGRRPGIFQAPSLESIGNRYLSAETPRSGLTPSTGFSTSQHSQSMHGVYPSLPSEGKNYFAHAQEKAEPDMRLHAFKNLLETEESYLSSLRILYQDYMMPLKHPENHSTCEPRLVDAMFYKIPQLYQHHEQFYENVKKCYSDWNFTDVKLGELFLNSFNKDALLETYTAYIKNYLNAREAVRAAKAKAAFRLFIEKCQLENKDKQGLGDLMIKPVQRIPRYELIIKDLLKHTPDSHQDREGLLIAQMEVHTLAVQMNHSEKEAEAAEKHDRLLADIEQLIEGCVDLCVPKRQFLRQDIIVELKGGNKKDRSLWLFNDLILCSTAKKGRTGSFRRSSMNLWSLGLAVDKLAIDFGNKYKFLWKFPLEDIEHVKGNTGLGRMTVDKQLQVLQNDFEILTNMNKLAVEIVCNHVQLDEALKEITTYVSRQISEKRQFQSVTPPGRIELGISTGDGMKTFLFEFPTEDTKAQFERLFANAKRSLTTQKNQWEPAFMKAIAISKTRAGMQFSCAAPNIDSTHVREVWVCNTDGYVGQVCFLNLESEPNQTQCITVCHAKICCIGQVPAWERRLVPASTLLQEISKGPLVQATNGRRHSSSASNPALAIMSWDDQDDSDEDNTSPVSTVDSHSSYNSPYSTNNSSHNYDNLQNADLISQPGQKIDPSSDRSRDGVAWKKDSDGSTVHGSLEDLLADGEALSEVAQSVLAGKDSMWLGTEDGKIHIYPSSENIRGTKHCIRLQHSAAVHCILYHDGQIFVALSNGDLVVYFRNLTTGEWDFENQKTKSKISAPHAITKMVVVGQKELWCGCQNQIRIIDTKDHLETDRFSVTNDNKRQIYCMAHFGYGVWVALDKRPQLKLFHAVSHEHLTEIDVSNAVSKMLLGADAIIRQHKAACLRITALLVCKQLLWVGTSAGVVLTLSLPKINECTSSLPLPLMPQGLAYGHTGHVRFLTTAEMPDKEQQSTSRAGSVRSSAGANKRRLSSPPSTVSVIISGGDGYEDFRMNSASESAGRDDSTNHLLVWRA